jgi:hypothetical protein
MLADAEPVSPVRTWGAAIAAVILVASVGAVFALNSGTAKAETKTEVPKVTEVNMPKVDPFPHDAAIIPEDKALATDTKTEATKAKAEKPADDPADESVANDKPEPKTTQKIHRQPTATDEQPKDEAVKAPAKDKPKAQPIDPNKVARANLPAATSNGEQADPNDDGYRPLSPGASARISVMHDDSGKPPAKLATPPKKSGNDVDPAAKPEKVKPFSPGMIDIRPSQNNPRTVGGSDTVREDGNGGIRTSSGSNPNAGITGAKALMKVAQQHMLTRNFSAAADAYEKAIKAGASPLSAYQRLGQCYQEMNRRAEAINAYSKAVRAMESAAAANPSQAERLQVSIDACKKAIRVLGG